MLFPCHSPSLHVPWVTHYLSLLTEDLFDFNFLVFCLQFLVFSLVSTCLPHQKQNVHVINLNYMWKNNLTSKKKLNIYSWRILSNSVLPFLMMSRVIFSPSLPCYIQIPLMTLLKCLISNLGILCYVMDWSSDYCNFAKLEKNYPTDIFFLSVFVAVKIIGQYNYRLCAW